MGVTPYFMLASTGSTLSTGASPLQQSSGRLTSTLSTLNSAYSPFRAVNGLSDFALELDRIGGK